MDSTSWRVSYFRSLKVNNVLNLLTKYLLQYRTVTIPHVGTIQLVQHPSQLDVADKIIQPPSFSAEIKREENVSAHQLNFLDHFLKRGHHSVLHDLKQFGDGLHDKINGPGFEWNGFGTLDSKTQSFSIPVEGLYAITAERVMRENPVLKNDPENLTGVQKHFLPFLFRQKKMVAELSYPQRLIVKDVEQAESSQHVE